MESKEKELEFIARNTVPYHFQADNIIQLMQDIQPRYFGRQAAYINSFTDHLTSIKAWQQSTATTQFPHDADFSYNNNEWGFRCENTAKAVDIMAFGCSVTYGVGVPTPYRWTDHMNSLTGCTVANYGIQGLSTSECSHMFAQITRFIKPKIAVFLLPEYSRTMLSGFYNDRLVYFHGFNNYQKSWEQHKWPLQYNTCDTYYQLPIVHHIDRFLIDLHTICTIAEARDINVIVGSWHTTTDRIIQQQNFQTYSTLCQLLPSIQSDHAGRDRMHPGLNYHHLVGKTVAQMVNNIIDQ